MDSDHSIDIDNIILRKIICQTIEYCIDAMAFDQNWLQNLEFILLDKYGLTVHIAGQFRKFRLSDVISKMPHFIFIYMYFINHVVLFASSNDRYA